MKSDKIFNKIHFFGGANDFYKLPISALSEIAFWGRSNVGKSSTINSIFNSKNIARVSQNPGRTQQINLFIVGDNNATIVDLPGYGYAKVSKTIAENLYRLCYDYLHNRQPKMVFLLIDSRRGLMPIDFDVIHALTVVGHPFYLLITKTDLVKFDELHKLKVMLKSLKYNFLMLSNKSKNGILELKNMIINIINDKYYSNK